MGGFPVEHSGIRQLFHGFCQIPDNPQCPLGELLVVWRRCPVFSDRAEKGLHRSRFPWRKACKLRAGASEYFHSRCFLLRHLSRYSAVACVAWVAGGGTESPELHSTRYAWQPGFPFRASLYAAGASKLFRGPASRCAADFLSRLLVTVLQLRVTGYRRSVVRFQRSENSAGSYKCRCA